MKKLSLALPSVVAFFAPQSLWACAVCFTGREGFMEAFYATTVLLILLPPTLLGTIGYFIYRNYKKQAEERNRQ